MRRFFAHRSPSPSMAVAFIALVAALSGTAIALPGKNTVDSGDLKNGQVKGKDIGKNAVTAKKVKNGTLTGADVKDASLTPSDFSGSVQGPKGDKGDKGDSGASVFNSSIPSGQTVKGVWGGRFPTPTANTYSFVPRVGFPVAAPAGLTDAQVSFPTGTPTAPVGEQDPTCTGSADVPTAPAGKVCVYVDALTTGAAPSVTAIAAIQLDGENTEQSKLGFGVSFTATGAANGSVQARGTWAYTAP